MEDLPPGPVIVTRDPSLLDDLERLCAAASVRPHVITEPDLVRRPWVSAPCVLVGDDCAVEVAALGLPRRADVVLVAPPPESPEVWRRGVALRAEHVAVLPDSQTWLADRLADVRDHAGVEASTIGVIGARGGAGASTLAVCVGMAAVAAGLQTMLIDVDPLGGGVELVAGCEDEPGLRWPEVTTTQGRVATSALWQSLPTCRGLAVLSTSRSQSYPLPVPLVCSVLSSVRRGGDLVVVDLPRRCDESLVDVVAALDAVVLVSTADVRSAAGASQLARALLPVCPDVRLVVRVDGGAQLPPTDLADSLGLHLGAVLTTRRATHRAVDDGLGPLLARRDRRQVAGLVSALRPSPRRVA